MMRVSKIPRGLHHRRPLWLALMILVTLIVLRPQGVQAQPRPLPDLPPELRPWVPWVLDRLGDEACPVVDGIAVCVWPGELILSLDNSGGKFRQRVLTDRQIQVGLPGSKKAWPQNVQVNGKRIPVLESSLLPVVNLGPGEHQIQGEFSWSDLPEVLTVPKATGSISLTLSGRPIAFPKRDEDSTTLWLRAADAPRGEPERLDLEVFRRIDDGVPLTVLTRLSLRVSGRAREVDFGKVALEGSTSIAVQSTLPVRLEPDQRLVVQVRPGTHSVDLKAIYASPPETLALAERQPPLPDREYWVWSPDPKLRQVLVDGAPNIDPSRTNLPAEWRQLQAFMVSVPGSLSFRTTQRGVPEQPPNRLEISRQIWPDLAGGGFTVADRVTGEMNRNWRLDLQSGDLGRVNLGGTDQLITVNSATGRPGVEVRTNAVDMLAEWRSDTDGYRLPAVGWSENADRAAGKLYVPPGWYVIDVLGADTTDGWLSTWDLFDAFFVLVLALIIARLGKPTWGAVALIALLLTHEVPDAPRWIWVCLLALIALLRVVPTGKLRIVVRGLWWVTAAVLVIIIVPFAVQEGRAALFPQSVESERPQTEWAQSTDSLTEIAAAPAARYRAGEKGKLASKSSGNEWEREQQNALQQQDPKAVIQTGPGLPSWQWAVHSFSWSGPVAKDHQIRILMLSPWQHAVLRFLRVFLVGLLAFFLLRASPIGPVPPAKVAAPKRPAPQSPADAPTSNATVGFSRMLRRLAPLFAVAILAAAQPAHAEVPSQQVLDELKQRLLRKPDCENDCIAVSKLTVTVRGQQLTAEAEVHAGATAAYKLPGPAASWIPASVSVNGESYAAVALLPDGYLHLRLPEGVHKVTLQGPIGGDSITLTPGTAPHYVVVESAGWDIDGLGEQGQLEGSLQLNRKDKTAPGEEPSARSGALDLPPWLEITRTLQLGVTWTIQTKVRRISPTGSPVMVRFPLLPGEEVTQADQSVKGGEVLISLGRDDAEQSFSSVLQPAPKLTFSAARAKPWSEVWVVECGPIWHCATEGLAPVQQEGSTPQPTFRPWPGDQLVVSLDRPAAAEGRSVTIERAEQRMEPGTRLDQGTLELRVRTSTGTVQKIALPPGAEVQQVLVGGAKQPLRREGDSLAVSLSPGFNTITVQWQQPGGLGLRYRVPRVDLSTDITNAYTTTQLPSERWIVLAGGGGWGPSVLFWAYLILIVIAAVVLARLPNAPLKAWEWALLGLGLTQVPAVVALLVASWFFLIAYRSRWNGWRPWMRNLGQIGIGMWTLVFLGGLIATVYVGLVVDPQMMVAGQGSYQTKLAWYTDRVTGALPEPWVISTPMWVWRVVMLAWALWLAWSLVKWLRWAWGNYTKGGIWQRTPRVAPVQVPAAPVPPPQPPAPSP